GRRSKGVGGRGRELKNKLKLLTRPIYTKLYQVISFSLYLVNDQVYGFPTHESAAVVLKFLEDYTGKGTVYALEVKVSKEGHRAYAKVQFTNNRSAEDIISLANQWLWYRSSYLKAWEMDSDIIPMPRTYAHCMEQLNGAPRIYDQVEDSLHSYFKETPNDQWVRTTDFTQSFCIGQSSSLCLEIPYGIQLPNFHKIFP
ncbi:unnamed protein product, partial [Ilex paraguariensis]